MAFLGNLGKKLGDAAGSAAEKAKDIAETTKLNSAISAEEKKINQFLLEIGKFVFEQERYNPESPVADLCSKIVSSLQTIEELKQNIANIKNN